jgi:hypothetical protein
MHFGITVFHAVIKFEKYSKLRQFVRFIRVLAYNVYVPMLKIIHSILTQNTYEYSVVFFVQNQIIRAFSEHTLKSRIAITARKQIILFPGKIDKNPAD